MGQRIVVRLIQKMETKKRLLQLFLVCDVAANCVLSLNFFLFTIWLQSRFTHIKAAVLIIAVLFFAWLWGVWGLFLGAPILAIAKVIFDRVDSLKPVGDLLGD
jgi:predicted PurR-regulated permease PerM